MSSFFLFLGEEMSFGVKNVSDDERGGILMFILANTAVSKTYTQGRWDDATQYLKISNIWLNTSHTKNIKGRLKQNKVKHLSLISVLPPLLLHIISRITLFVGDNTRRKKWASSQKQLLRLFFVRKLVSYRVLQKVHFIRLLYQSFSFSFSFQL